MGGKARPMGLQVEIPCPPKGGYPLGVGWALV